MAEECANEMDLSSTISGAVRKISGGRPLRVLSVCSGIEAATVAWTPLGWEFVAFAEIEPFASAVLAHHYPNVPNWGDITKFKRWPDADVDVLCGGTPCQSFSNAGLRAGLDDPRGQLSLVFAAIAARYRPKWVVWENVPGVLSSDEGRDFASLLGLLSGQQIEPPKEGWQSFGVVGGIADAYGLAWRVLDAQYTRVDGFPRAVPQRRQRVFLVGHLGDWRRAAAVLLERESLRGDPAPRRSSGQDATAKSLRSTDGGIDREDGHTLIVGDPGVAGPLMHASGPHAHGHGDFLSNQSVDAGHILAFGGNDTRGPIEVATACRAKGGTGHGDFESETFIAHAFKASHFTRGKDGAPAAVAPPLSADADKGDQDTLVTAPSFVQPVADPLVAGEQRTYTHEGANNFRTRNVIAFDSTQITHPENRSNPAPGAACHTLPKSAHAPCIAFSGKDYGNDAAEEIAPTLRAMHHVDGNANAGGQVAVASMDAHAMKVRRLTPVECERLQGFEDNYTLIPYRGAPAKDGPRYRALGNSWAVPCARWIGIRIAMVDSLDEKEQA